jgi:hypothetical protein
MVPSPLIESKRPSAKLTPAFPDVAFNVITKALGLREDEELVDELLLELDELDELVIVVVSMVLVEVDDLLLFVDEKAQEAIKATTVNGNKILVIFFIRR